MGNEAVIVAASRTAIGTFGGSLAGTPAHELGATVIKALLEQTGVDPIYIHAFGIALVLSRVGHAKGISTNAGRSAGRFYGSLGTLLVIAVLSVWLLANTVANGVV